MAGPLREGMTGTAPDGTKVVVRNGRVVPVDRTPPGTTPRPEYGPNAYETSDGAILSPTAKGGVQTMRGPQTAGAEARTRLALGLGPSVEAQRRLFELERWNQGEGKGALGSNPNDELRFGLGEDAFGGAVGNLLNPDDPTKTIMTRLAKQLGGKRYREYNQAAKTFESAFLPILSGAAVTPTEASRMIAAALPAPGDDPYQLAQKSKQRAMMINAAAKMLGEKPPFPRIPAMDLSPREGMGRGPAVEVSVPARPELGVGRAYSAPRPAASGYKILSVE